MSTKKPGNAVRLHVFVDTLDNICERPLTVIIGKSKTIYDLRKEFSEQKYYPAEEQHWVMNGTYCFDEFEIKLIIETMTPFKKGFVAFLLMMSVEEKNRLPEYFATFAERLYHDVNPDDRWCDPEPELMIIADVFDNTQPEPVVGWNCTQCTYFNKPYLEYCDICNICRPQDFKMPDTYYYTKEDKQRMDKEKETEGRQNQGLKNNSKQENIASLEKPRKMAKEKGLIFSEYIVKCPICEMTYEPGEAIVLRDCLHTICKTCLKNYVTTINDPKVKCFNVNCMGRLEDQEIQGILNDEQYKRYQQLSLKTIEGKILNTFHCRTPNCDSRVVVDDGVDEFLCPRCQKTNCILCGVVHEEQSCKAKAYNDEAAEIYIALVFWVVMTLILCWVQR